MDEWKISVRDIHKSFGNSKVLNGISLEVPKSEVVAILGPSGSGKTTLLRCINFLERADAGEIAIGNVRVDAKSATKKQIMEIRLKTGFVFQNFNLFKHMTAERNVMEGLTVIKKIPANEAREQARKALDAMGLSEKYGSYPTQLSGGEQQRVAMARAIVLNPEVILFDEPTSALDPELVGETLQVIKEIAKTGITMIIVTHEVAFAHEVANHAIFMENGAIVEQGSSHALFYEAKEERTRKFLKQLYRS
jgi:L-cystine transport system ATP-binding protein